MDRTRRRIVAVVGLLAWSLPAYAQLSGRPAEEWIKSLDGPARVALLKTGGRIVVVDFEGGKGPHTSDATLQVPREQLTAWMKDAGLSLVDDVKLFPDKYVLVYRRN